MMNDEFDVATSDLCGEHRYGLKNHAVKEWHVYLGSPQHVSYPDSKDLTLSDRVEEQLAEMVVNRLVSWIISEKNPREIFCDEVSDEHPDAVKNGLSLLEKCTDRLHPAIITLLYNFSQIQLGTPQNKCINDYVLTAIAHRVYRAISFYVSQNVTSKTMKVGEQSALVKCTQDTWWTTLASTATSPHPYEIASACIGLKSGLQTSPEQFKGITKVGFFNPNLNMSCVYALDKEKLGD